MLGGLAETTSVIFSKRPVLAINREVTLRIQSINLFFLGP